MTRLLGIDPGSRVTGFGIIDIGGGGRAEYVASGCVQAAGEALPERLRIIFEGMGQVIALHRPDQVAIERVFVHRNVDSALKLGQARGAALCAVVSRGLSVAEYTPTEIKQALVGKGNAEKTQVQHLVKSLLQLPGMPQADAADALACALCHGHTAQTLLRTAAAAGRRRGGWR